MHAAGKGAKTGGVPRTVALAAERLERCIGDKEGRLQVYCLWLARSVQAEDVHVIAAFILLDRVLSRHPLDTGLLPRVFGGARHLYWRERLLACALCLAIKTLSDGMVRNTRFAKHMSIALPHFNALERVFLCLINFDLYISREDFMGYVDALNTPAPATSATRTASPSTAGADRGGVVAKRVLTHDDATAGAERGATRSRASTPQKKHGVMKSPRHLPASPMKNAGDAPTPVTPLDGALGGDGAVGTPNEATAATTPRVVAGHKRKRGGAGRITSAALLSAVGEPVAFKRSSSSASTISSSSSARSTTPPSAKRMRQSCAAASIMRGFAAPVPHASDLVSFKPFGTRNKWPMKLK